MKAILRMVGMMVVAWARGEMVAQRARIVAPTERHSAMASYARWEKTIDALEMGMERMAHRELLRESAEWCA